MSPRLASNALFFSKAHTSALNDVLYRLRLSRETSDAILLHSLTMGLRLWPGPDNHSSFGMGKFLELFPHSPPLHFAFATIS